MVTHKHEERLKPRVHEIIIPATRGGTRRAGVAESFVYEPTTIEEEPLGYLFVLGEIMGEMPAAGSATGTKKQSSGETRAGVPRRRQDWGHLLNVIASLIKREYYTHANRSAHAALEAALRKANAAISELSPANTSWANSFHGAAVALSRSNLHFSAIGNMALYLKRGKRLTDVAATIPRATRRNTRPAFRTIASGKLAPDDIMLVTSARTISALAGDASPFMALPPFAEIASKLTALLRTAEAGPAAVLAVSVELETPPKPTVLDNPAAPPAPESAAFEPTETEPGIMQPAESRFDLWLLKTAALLHKTAALPAQAIEPARRWWRAGAAILIVTVLAVWGAQRIPSLFERSATRATNRASLREARDKRDTAEKALLSGKNTQAKQLLAQALGILRSARADSATRSDAEALATDIRNLELKADRVELITEPETVFRTDALAVKFAASGAVTAGGMLVFYSEESNILVRVQPNQGETETTFANLEAQEGIRAGTAVQDEVMLLTTRNRLIKLMGANRGTQFVGLAPPHTVDMKSFGSSLYFLTSAPPYILKAPVRDGTLQPTRPWLKDESDAPAVSSNSRMAIDGNIWILEDTSRNELIRFRDGRRTGTIGLGVDAASAVQALAADSDHETIAAISMNPARLITLSKTGETLSRIASPMLEQTRSLMLLENAAIVVTPTKAFRFELPPSR